MFIDTHTHFYSEDFDSDRNESIQRAKSLGVHHFILPAIDSKSIRAMERMHEEYPLVTSLMAGLHPVYVKPETYRYELDIVASQLKENANRYVAIGEIGIDLHWDKTTLDIQKEAFQLQIQWAKKYNLPIVIHCRKAYEEVFEVLEKEADRIEGVFHCFGGTLNQAKRAIDLGMKLGIGGVVTFKNAKLANVVQQLPLEALVLETDAPYLAPAPFRGKRNESSYIPYIAEKIATLHNCSVQQIADITTATAKKVFKLTF